MAFNAQQFVSITFRKKLRQQLNWQISTDGEQLKAGLTPGGKCIALSTAKIAEGVNFAGRVSGAPHVTPLTMPKH
jgi:hypothetical protein